MLRLSWDLLRARRRRLASSGVAVVLGVAFLVGTIVLGDTISASFSDLFSETTAGTDVVVRSESPLEASFAADAGRRPIDEALLDQLAALDGVQVAEAQVQGYGQILGVDGDPIGGNGPPRLAANWVTTPELNPYELVEGRPPQAPDEVVINRGAAVDGELEVGDRTVVQLPEPVEVSVVGISTFGGADGFGETTMTAFTLKTAQELLMREPGMVSSILVNAEDGQDPDELRTRVAQLLPAGVEAITGEDIIQERLDSLGSLGMVRVSLVAFALIAVVIAGISINNAFSITVAQRTRELALLRAIGASSKQVRRMVRFEALVVGAIGSSIGVAAGIGVGVLLKGVFAGFGLALPVGGLVVERPAVVIGLTVGILATLWAARTPARRAGRVTPIEALGAAAGDGPSIRRGRVIAAFGALLSGSALLAAGTTGAVGLVGVGALLLLAATLLIAPVLLPPIAQLLGAGLRRSHGLKGELAEQNARRQPRRTARTATALLIGVAVVAMFTVFAASLAGSVERGASAGFGDADLAVTTPVFGGGSLSREVLTELNGVAEVEAAVGVASGTVVIGGEETELVAADLGAARDVLDVSVRDGSIDDLGPDNLAISETRAEDHDWSVGSAVEVTYLDGSTSGMTVGAVIRDNDVLAGIVLPLQTWLERSPQPGYSNVYLTLIDGVSPDQGRAAINDIARRYAGDVQERAEFAEASAAGLDMLLGIVYVMLALAILISLLGIANALSMAVHERRQEIGLLRAVGQTRRQTRSVLRLESVIVATFGTSLGLLLGTTFGIALYLAVSDGDPPSTVPWNSLLVVLVVGVVAGIGAAWRPARRAARLDILDALATA